MILLAQRLAALTLLIALSACAPQPEPITGTAESIVVTQVRSPSPETVSNPTANPTTTILAAGSCTPTFDDGLSPALRLNAPERSSVGSGHTLTGTVRSSRDCAPIAHAKLEFQPEYPDRGHPPEASATLFTDSSGTYRFECDPPDHIHMRISAPGYRTITQNSYHPEGKTEGIMDFVLEPKSP